MPHRAPEQSRKGIWNVDNADLLKQLRIERDQRDDDDGRVRAGRGSRASSCWCCSRPVLVVCAARQRGRGAGRHARSRRRAAARRGAVLQATGYVTARREATVSAQITGTLTKVMIEEGEHVEQGQVLALLDDTAQRAALAQAKAQLRAAQAQLVQFAGAARAGQARLQARRGSGRAQAGSEQAVEAGAHAGRDAGRAGRSADASRSSSRRPACSGAQVQLDYCTVRAPFTGVVIAKAAQVGEIVSPFSAGGGFTRTGIGTIVDMDSLEIEVDVNESYINRVVAGQPIEAVLDAYPDWKIPGARDRDHSDRRSQQGDGEGARRDGPEGSRASCRTWACACRSSRKRQAGAQPRRRRRACWCRRARSCSATARARCSSIDGDKARLRTVTPGQTMGELRAGRRRRQRAATRVVRAPPAEMNDGARHGSEVPFRGSTVTQCQVKSALQRSVAEARDAGASSGDEPHWSKSATSARSTSAASRRSRCCTTSTSTSRKGDFFALMGPSGSGKTTLLNLIGGLDSPTDGSISVGGERIDKLGEGALAQWRAVAMSASCSSSTT